MPFGWAVAWRQSWWPVDGALPRCRPDTGGASLPASLPQLKWHVRSKIKDQQVLKTKFETALSSH